MVRSGPFDHSIVTVKLMSSPTLHRMTTLLYMWPSILTTPGPNPRVSVPMMSAMLRNYTIEVALMFATNGAVRRVSSAVVNVLSTNALLTTVRGPNYAIMYVALMAPSSLCRLRCPVGVLVLVIGSVAEVAVVVIVLVLVLPLEADPPPGSSSFRLTCIMMVLFRLSIMARSYGRVRTNVLTLKKYVSDSMTLKKTMTIVATNVP